MSSHLFKQLNLVEEIPEVAVKEHHLYFPSVTNGNGDIQSLLPRGSNLFEYDLEEVPKWENITDKYNYLSRDYDIILGSPMFIKKLISSHHICICDMHIDELFFYYLINILKKHSDKINMLNKIEIFMDSNRPRRDILNKLKNLNVPISIKIYHFELYKKHFHDRFVCFDDELWHFGGTVGGIQKSLTAFSTGWNDCGLRSLLQMCIQRKYCWEEKINE